MKRLSIIAVCLLSVFFFSCKKEVVSNRNTTYTTHLKLTFTNIANVPVSNVNSVSDWNTFFGTATTATTAFQSVSVVGNEVSLNGGLGLVIKQSLFYKNNFLSKLEDDSTINEVKDFSFANCYNLASYSSLKTNKTGTQSFQGSTKLKQFLCPNINEIGSSCFDYATSLDSVNVINAVTVKQGGFGGCSSLKTILLPNATTIEDYSFILNSSLIYLDISKCVNLGMDVQDYLVFDGINNNKITVKIPTALNTNQNILNLQISNNLTIVN